MILKKCVFVPTMEMVMMANGNGANVNIASKYLPLQFTFLQNCKCCHHNLNGPGRAVYATFTSQAYFAV